MAIALKKMKGLQGMGEESRVINVSSKNQITIPQKFAETLGLSKQVECILKENEIVIRRLVKPSDSFDDYSDLILKDLVDKGLQGDELVIAFTEAKGKMKTAAQRLRQDALAAVTKDTRDPDQVLADIFNDRK